MRIEKRAMIGAAIGFCVGFVAASVAGGQAIATSMAVSAKVRDDLVASHTEQVEQLIDHGAKAMGGLKADLDDANAAVTRLTPKVADGPDVG